MQQQQIVQLKGNMRVFCRVKPIIDSDYGGDKELNQEETRGVIGLPQLEYQSNGE